MKKSNFWKSYGFLILMLTGIVAGCVVGAIWPAVMEVVDGETIIVDKGATVLEPLGTVFLNLMFCIAVPTVFCSISSSIANMQSAKRAGKIMGVTIATFLVTAAIAAVIMYVTVRLIPPVVGEYALVEGEVGGTLGVADMIVNFFTKPDFTELFSRRAILPLIVAAILFGFGIQMAGGAETKTAKLLEDVTNCIMKTFKIITYYAPIGFFGFFAYLIAYHGSDLIGDYGRALAIYYILSFVYMLVFSPDLRPLRRRKGRGEGHVLQAVPPGCHEFWHVLVRRDDSDQHGGRGGNGHLQGRIQYRHPPRRDDAHGRLRHVRHHQGRVPVRDVRAGLHDGPRNPCDHRRRVLFGRHVRHSRRRRYGRAGSVLDLLPGSSGRRLPPSRWRSAIWSIPRDDGQLCRRLRCLLHRLPLC